MPDNEAYDVNESSGTESTSSNPHLVKKKKSSSKKSNNDQDVPPHHQNSARQVIEMEERNPEKSKGCCKKLPCWACVLIIIIILLLLAGAAVAVYFLVFAEDDGSSEDKTTPGNNPTMERLLNQKVDGAQEVSSINSEKTCTDYCEDKSDCTGVDWDKDDGKCWEHTDPKRCSDVVQDTCCNHWRKECEDDILEVPDELTEHQNTKVEGAKKVPPSKAQSKTECIDYCAIRKSCKGVDWSKESEECWEHLDEFFCSSAKSDNCCDHWRKECKADPPPEDLVKITGVKFHGADKVSLTDVDTENTCRDYCKNRAECRGVDWVIMAEECWEHKQMLSCSNAVPDDCCNHWTKDDDCPTVDKLEKMASFRANGASKVDSAFNEDECIRRCEQDDDCHAVDWDHEKNECYEHDDLLPCSSLIEASCCNHWTKGCEEGVMNLVEHTTTKAGGASKVELTINTKETCRSYCAERFQCQAVDWNDVDQECWEHTELLPCSIFETVGCCTHFSKGCANTNLRKYTDERKNGAMDVTAQGHNSEIKCAQYCEGKADCKAVDWNKVTKTCWEFTISTDCNEHITDLCCNHWSKQCK